MLFKLLLTSFLLHSKTRHHTSTVIKNIIDDIIEKNMSEYMKDPIPPVDKSAVVSNFFKKNSSGKDERYDYYCNKTKDDEMILNISKFMIQMKLLQRLESPALSQFDKIMYIKEYEKVHGEYNYNYNLTAGGLFNDFFKEI